MVSAAAFSRFREQRYFGSLDGLRALSIIAVIWSHTAPSWTGAAGAETGANGVTLFFAISGFLITTLLLRERERHGSIDLKAFYLRRTLRIFPLYYAVLLIYLIAVLTFENGTEAGENFFSNLKYFATYTSNLFVPLDGRVIFFFAWSLATEEQFYLIWPPLMILLGSQGRALTLLGLVMAICVLAQWANNPWAGVVPIAITGGCALAILLHSEKGYALCHTVLGHSASGLAILALLVPALVWPALPDTLIHVLCVALVGACVMRESHLLSGLLRFRPLAYIGTVSYGMYLIHMLCKNLMIRILGALNLEQEGLALFFSTLALVVLVAGLSYRYFESFFLRLKLGLAR